MKLAWTGLLVLGACPPRTGSLESQLDAEVVALRQRLEVAEHKAETCDDGAPGDRLYVELHQVFTGSELDVTRRGRITIVTIPASHLFGKPGFEIRAEAQMSLDLLATALNLNPDYAVRIEGHTDDSLLPTEVRRMVSDNWSYSVARSMVVMRALIDGFKVDERRFSIMGRGEFAPVGNNDTESGRARNRRIVVYIYPPGMSP